MTQNNEPGRVINVGQLKNYVVLVLDASGSMAHLRTEVLSLHKKQMDTIRAETGEQTTRVGVVVFNSKVHEPTEWLKAPEEIKDLGDEYVPTGSTALYDAVGWTIEALRGMPDADDPNTSFLVVTITDGEENASTKFNASRLAELVREVQATNRWTFAYMGNESLDFSKEATLVTHTQVGNMVGFAATSAGMHAASEKLSRGTSSYYTGRRMGSSHSASLFSDDDTDTADATTKTKKRKTSSGAQP